MVNRCTAGPPNIDPLPVPGYYRFSLLHVKLGISLGRIRVFPNTNGTRILALKAAATPSTLVVPATTRGTTAPTLVRADISSTALPDTSSASPTKISSLFTSLKILHLYRGSRQKHRFVIETTRWGCLLRSVPERWMKMRAIRAKTWLCPRASSVKKSGLMRGAEARSWAEARLCLFFLIGVWPNIILQTGLPCAVYSDTGCCSLMKFADDDVVRGAVRAGAEVGGD